ncbi:MAG: pyridoxal phosphate-dependent aminotransferase [Nitrospinae bacterium]|nr:pyridoxal phosphate-dependent aminotransferase [Nitrospinota bacterium]
MKLTRRIQSIKPSPTLELSAKVGALKAEGKDIIGFAAGEPDFDTPDNIKEAAVIALRQGKTIYTAVSGIPELKDAITAKLKRDNGVSYKREEIIVSCGAKHSLYNIAMTILEEGDDVIIPAPYWVSYIDIVCLTGATPVIVETTKESGFRLSPEQFAAAITPRTRAIFLNYPNNPTGATYTREQLQELARIAVKNEIMIISDEVYEKIIYTPEPHVSIASLGEDVKDFTITVNSLSKTYSMTGWRIGYAAANKKLVSAMTNIQSQSTSNPTSIAQYASVEALNGPQDTIESRRLEFEKRKDYILKRIETIPGVTCDNPDGTFYIFADFSAHYDKKHNGLNIDNSVKMAGFLLEEGNVALVPGIAFGNDSCLRLTFASSIETIKEGLDRINNTLKRLE